MEETVSEDEYSETLARLELFEESLNKLTMKLLLVRKDNIALRNRISALESEKESLRERRDETLSQLKNLLNSFEDAGY